MTAPGYLSLQWCMQKQIIIHCGHHKDLYRMFQPMWHQTKMYQFQDLTV